MSREKPWPAICACGATTELEVKFCAERDCQKTTVSLPAQAQPAMSQADFPPPSRASNAASENGAASLLLKLRAQLQDFPTEAYGGMGAQELIRDFRDDVLCLIDSMLQPMPEPTIRAAVYGCTDAQCVCGRCAPVRLAIDPWQGLGKTWGDK